MTHAILSMDNINKSFGEGSARVDAVKSVTLRVDPGEVIALIGPSGSGKSTLLSIAGALLTPDDGRLSLDGEDLTQRAPKDLAALRLKKIGFIFQGSNLISYLTGREQLMFIADLVGMAKDEAEQRASRLLDELGMAERADHYPEEMSGGQRQRIAIARALMNDPRIILADEPTASLDSTRGRQVVEMIANEVHGSDRAAILVTHDERLIDLCDRVVRIHDGELDEIEDIEAQQGGVLDGPAPENGKDEEKDKSLIGKLLHR